MDESFDALPGAAFYRCAVHCQQQQAGGGGAAQAGRAWWGYFGSKAMMLQAFAVLLIFQCVGEGVGFVTGLPIPGPVIGMLLLFAALLSWPRLLELMEQTAAGLLQHLSLLFVPAGVGIMVAASSGRGQW